MTGVKRYSFLIFGSVERDNMTIRFKKDPAKLSKQHTRPPKVERADEYT